LREGRAAGWWRLHEIEIVARLKENVMLIYLVRWPDLSASFVQAESEEHLLDVLDQVGNVAVDVCNVSSAAKLVDGGQDVILSARPACRHVIDLSASQQVPGSP